MCQSLITRLVTRALSLRHKLLWIGFSCTRVIGQRDTNSLAIRRAADIVESCGIQIWILARLAFSAGSSRRNLPASTRPHLGAPRSSYWPRSLSPLISTSPSLRPRSLSSCTSVSSLPETCEQNYTSYLPLSVSQSVSQSRSIN